MNEKTNKHHDFALRLDSSMSEKGLSVKELSLACNVTYEMARRYTLGMTKPRGERLEAIAKLLNVSVFWLDYGDPERADCDRPEEFSDMSADEKSLVRTFRQLHEVEGRHMLRVFELRLRELREHYKKIP